MQEKDLRTELSQVMQRKELFQGGNNSIKCLNFMKQNQLTTNVQIK